MNWAAVLLAAGAGSRMGHRPKSLLLLDGEPLIRRQVHALQTAGASQLVVVLGHSHCGAIIGACENVELDHLSSLLYKIKPAVNAVLGDGSAKIYANNNCFVQKVADKNVQLTVEQIRSKSPLLDAMVKSGEIGIVGGMYDIETGKVKFYSEV